MIRLKIYLGRDLCKPMTTVLLLFHLFLPSKHCCQFLFSTFLVIFFGGKGNYFKMVTALLLCNNSIKVFYG